MKRYIYIIIGIVVAALIAILVLFIIKTSSGNSPAGSLGTTSSTTGGSLPVTGTQESTGNSSGTDTGTATGGSAPTSLNLPSSGSGTSGTSTIITAPGAQMTVQAFGALSTDPAIDYFVAANNNITGIEPTGQVFSVSNGQTNILDSSTTDGIISASFSSDGKRVLVSYGDPANPQGEVFNVGSSTWTALPQGLQSPQWSPAGNYQIAYLAKTNSGELSLATIDAANLKKAPSVLFTLNMSDLTLQWPVANEFILSDRASSQSAGSIWAFNSTSNTFAPLVYEEPGAEGIWSRNPSIPYGLVFFDNAATEGSTLQLQAISGGLPTQPLSLSTLPSKCAFNTEEQTVSATSSTPSSATSTKTGPTSTPYLALYCGIPRSSSGFSSARLPDDYNMMSVFTSDDIYKVNTATGASQVLWNDPTQNMDVSDVKFANNALFFVNRYDQKLYGITFSS